jgi:uncharacterized protein YbbC (DUF1343 family)
MRPVLRHGVLILAAALIGWLASAAPAAGALDDEALESVSAAVRESIRAGETPGAVVLIGHAGAVVYRRAFGRIGFDPAAAALTPETLFDLASLTKVVATTPAVVKLAAAGRLALDRPAATYWPAFASRGKAAITVRGLLTHYSGLRPGVPARPAWSGEQEALDRIAADAPVHPPGERFVYSDVNFIVLGELVRRTSGESLEAYCRREIFAPLGMRETLFRPPPALRPRIAPTTDGLRGVVHDPTTRRMGGVSGAAGLFATADDLSRLAQALIDEGRHPGGALLDPESVAALGTPQSPAGKLPRRGLGWAIASDGGSLSALLPPGSFAHKGYTGTLLWIDPPSRTHLVVLANRIAPDGEARSETLRDRVLMLVAAAVGRTPAAPREAAAAAPAVRPGVEALAAQGFAPLAGKRVGLITNRTGRDAAGRRTIDLLRAAPGVSLETIFTPEHGLEGRAEGRVADGRDPASGLPVASLYGRRLRPSPEMLAGIDALVCDLQDAGVRFYTYATTMAYAMEAAAAAGIGFWVLDRPNPIGADRVAGPVMDPGLKGFTGYFPLPVRHGMTIGELARLFNAENRIGAALAVEPMRGYRRDMLYDETGLPWIDPSPNLRSLDQALLYPGVALAEASNVSVGRGTPTPFELLGAPWIDGERLAAELGRRGIEGALFRGAAFTPAADPYAGRLCRGVKITVTDRRRLDSVLLGIEILAALRRLYPQRFALDRALGLVGSAAVLAAIGRGEEPRRIAAGWQGGLEEFQRLRRRHLLYPESPAAP